MVNFDVGSLEELVGSLLDLRLLLGKVVVELIDELFGFLEAGDVALTSAIPLSFNHRRSLKRLDHFHLESSTLDLSLVHLGAPLLRGQYGLHLFRF